MKVSVTWDAADVFTGRRIKDNCGAKCVIVQSDSKTTPYSIYREADGFIRQPMPLINLVNLLNDGQYVPECFK